VKNIYPIAALSLFLAACDGSSGGQKAPDDSVSPVVTAPEAITFAAVDSSGVPATNDAVVEFLAAAIATDNVDGAVSVSNDAPDVFPLGDKTVTFEATDAAGNEGVATTVVTVTDQSAPVLSLPADVSFVATSAAGISATDAQVTAFLEQASANDNVDSSVEVTNDALAIFEIGETPVVFTASDAAANSVSETVIVTVTGASQSGSVVKGPLLNATVFFDYDGDKELDADEPSTTTDANGDYELSETSNAPETYSVVVLMGADTVDFLSGESYADSGVILEAVKGGSVITPLTTLYSVAVNNSAEGEEPSLEAFSAALGVPEGVDIATYNPYAKDESGDYVDVATASQVEAVAQSLMTALEVISESVVGMSKTALKSDTGVSQVQAATIALKSLAKVATTAAKAATGTAADTLDLSDLADISEVNNEVLASLASTDEGSLGTLLQDTAASSGVTVDVAAAEVTGAVVLSLSANTIANVSKAFNELSDESFGSTEASALSRIKTQAVNEVAEASTIVVAAVSVQQDAGQTVLLIDSDVDVSSVITLDDTDALGAAVTLNEQEVISYQVTTVAPVIESENSFDAAENQTAVGVVIAADTAGDTLAFSLSGADAGALTISSSGVLAFLSAPDFESKTTYQATVTVTDSNANKAVQNITINITDANDSAPIITSSSSFVVDENQSAIGSVVASSASNEALTYALSGSDAAAMVISDSGLLSFVSAPDYEVKSSYSASVTVSDGTNDTSSPITVSVENLNDSAPIIISANAFTVKENVKSVATISAIDADFNALSYGLSGSDASSFSISTLGTLRFVTAPNFEVKTSYSLTVNVSDGETVSSMPVTVTVTNVNDVAPVITSSNLFSAAENQTSVGTVTATDTDSETLSFTLSGADASAFDLSNTGVLSFVSAPDFEDDAGYSVSVTVTDGLFSTVQVIAVTVTDEADTFTLADSAVTLTDFYPLDGTTVTNELEYLIEGSQAQVDLRSVPLNLTNIENAIFGGEFQTPVISFDLSELPVGSGSETVNINLIDGLDGTRESGERQVNVTLNIDWESDGTTAQVTVPSQEIGAFYKTGEGVQINVQLTNGDADVVSVTAAGADYPATLDVKLVSLITQLSSLPLEDILSAGVYHIEVTTSIPLKASTGETLSGLSAIVEIADAFKLSGSTVTLNDYNPEDGSASSSDLEANLVDGFLVVDLRDAPLNLLNMQNAVYGLDFKTPTVKFGLSAIPSGLGSETVTVNLIDGVDAIRDSGERQVSVELDIDWDADGVAALITVPAQDIAAFYKTRDGVQIDVEVSNVDSDMMSVTSNGAIYPATLELKLLSLIAQLSALPLADLLSAGVYHVDVSTTMPMIAPNGKAVDGLKAIIEIK